MGKRQICKCGLNFATIFEWDLLCGWMRTAGRLGISPVAVIFQFSSQLVRNTCLVFVPLLLKPSYRYLSATSHNRSKLKSWFILSQWPYTWNGIARGTRVKGSGARSFSAYMIWNCDLQEGQWQNRLSSSLKTEDACQLQTLHWLRDSLDWGISY